VRCVRLETVADTKTADAITLAWQEVASGADAELLLGCTVSPSAGFAACRWVAEAAAGAPANTWFGLNCCEGPEGLRPIVELLIEERGAGAVWIDPSAGLPPHQQPEEWAERMAELSDGFPLRAVGGCCGTTPRHIAQLRKTMEF
jgi:5-methyltetrahydrofolate--homocysteine methyltransferase